MHGIVSVICREHNGLYGDVDIKLRERIRNPSLPHDALHLLHSYHGVYLQSSVTKADE